MPQKAVAHASKGKGPSGGLTDHNERREGYDLPKNVDPARAHLNVIDRSYESLGHDLDERARTVIEEAGVTRKVQSNAVLFNPMILSGSHEQMIKIMERGELPEWIEDTRKFVEDKYGKENIISFAMHADELTPHIHVCVVPIIKDQNKKGKDVVRLSAKDKFNPEELTKLQTEYAEAMKKWGLERGKSSKLTGAKHQDTKQFYKDLPEKIQEKKAEIAELQENVKELKKEIRIDTLKKGATEVLDIFTGKQRHEIKAKDAQISILNEKLDETYNELVKVAKTSKKIIGDLQQENTKLISKNKQLENENKELKKTNNQLLEKIKDLTTELKELALTTLKEVINRVKNSMIKDKLPMYYDYSEKEGRVIRVNVEEEKKKQTEQAKIVQQPKAPEVYIPTPDEIKGIEKKQDRGLKM
jgi:hypothetical protein